MEYTTLCRNTRDLDTTKGIVSFYFADFNSIDANKRRIEKNAFNRTFKNNFKRYAHLLNHDPSTIIGKPLEVNSDPKGAYMVSQLSKSSAGRDALILYEEGVYNEHSFGFQIIKSIQEKDIEVVNELKMWEASTVTWGANPNTPTISLNKAEDLLHHSKLSEEILAKLDILISNSTDARRPVKQHSAPQNDIMLAIDFLNNKY